MASVTLNKIQILKTGLANVQERVDMSLPENREWFESLAEPGTLLVLKRVKDREDDPFRIEVLSPDGRYLGRVTPGKNETAARMMDAGLKLTAIVNRSLPVHGSDLPSPGVGSPAPGWDEESREDTEYGECCLPFGIYYEEG